MVEKQIEKIIDDIYLILSGANDTNFDKFSLHTGKSGLLIFYSYYYKLKKKEEVLSKIKHLFNQVANSIIEDQNELNFAHGVFGMLWALKISNKGLDNKLIDNEELNSLDEEIMKLTIELLKNGYLDFMHGGLGGLLALEEEVLNLTNNEIFSILIEASTFNENGKYLWIDYEDNKQHYNLGLAHGQPSIWYFLYYIAKDNAELLEKAVHVIVSSYKTILEFKTSDGKFPGYVEADIDNYFEPNGDLKLSWCYGDLTIANTLILIGKQINNDYLFEEGLRLGLETIKRNNFETAGVKDLCLCHGVSSLIVVYDNMFNLTKNIKFKEAANNWAKVAIQHYKSNEILFYETEKKDPSRYQGSLLNGYVGLGLALISNMDNKLLDWNRSIILSY